MLANAGQWPYKDHNSNGALPHQTRENPMTAMTMPAQIAADYLATVDAKLAKVFIARPFHRVALAKAFAKGLRSDPMQMGLTIIDLAELDLAERMEALD